MNPNSHNADLVKRLRRMTAPMDDGGHMLTDGSRAILLEAAAALEQQDGPLDAPAPTKAQEDIRERVLTERDKGNIVYRGLPGSFMGAKLDEFVEQPADGILYDLNRDEAVILTFIHEPKWVNDFAAAQVIRKLVQQRDEARQSAGAEREAPMKLWLWRNFVDGDPQYWAFESPFPTYENGDPITLGSPAGYAIVKPCVDGRDGRTDESVVEEIKRALEKSNVSKSTVGGDTKGGNASRLSGARGSVGMDSPANLASPPVGIAHGSIGRTATQEAVAQSNATDCSGGSNGK